MTKSFLAQNVLFYRSVTYRPNHLHFLYPVSGTVSTISCTDGPAKICLPLIKYQAIRESPCSVAIVMFSLLDHGKINNTLVN